MRLASPKITTATQLLAQAVSTPADTLRDKLRAASGTLVDARSSGISTSPGAFKVNLQRPNLVNTSGSSLRVATVLAYNWALGTQDLDAMQRYIGSRWFNNANQFSAPPNVQALEFPKPAMQLSLNNVTSQQLELVWRVSFADGCGADNGWTAASGTSGRATILDPEPGANYGLNCWNQTSSATANFAANTQLSATTQPVQIHWQTPPNQQNETAGYRLFVGERSASYSQVVQLPANLANSHTLHLAPGNYFVAMSTLGHNGFQSALSREIAIRID